MYGLIEEDEYDPNVVYKSSLGKFLVGFVFYLKSVRSKIPRKFHKVCESTYLTIIPAALVKLYQIYLFLFEVSKVYQQ